MSHQGRTGIATSLEQVFLSREFAQPPRRALLGDRARGAGLPAFEQVLLLDRLRRRARPVASCDADGGVTVRCPVAGERGPDRAAVHAAVLPSALPSVLRESNRHRAIAAVSGIAAAALVVAGLASGGAPHGQGGLSAQGPRAGAHPPVGSHSGSQAGLSPGAGGAGGTLAASSGSSGSPHALLTGQLTRTGQSGPSPAVTVVVSPGTTVTVVPSPVPPREPTGSGTGGAPSAPAPAAPATTNPAAPVVVVVGNTVTTAGSAVTTATDQAGSSLPAAAPATGALGVGPTGALGSVGASVTGLTQGLNSTTA